jgi:organic radical activating enzyme
MQALNEFMPDVIAEITTACDRRCPGCYSPTLVSNESPEDLYNQHPELFMSPELFDDLLQSLQKRDLIISLRGGEPSRHLKLLDMIHVASRYCKTIYVETHARWILLEENNLTRLWIEGFRRHKVITKISFDSMHALKGESLEQITKTLDRNSVTWQVAITEESHEEFLKSRMKCTWIPDERITFQHKVRNHNELIQPRFGIISINGNIIGRLTSKESFQGVNV